MSRKLYQVVKRLWNGRSRNLSHGDLIIKLLNEDVDTLKAKHPIFVETGCGLSTLALAEMGKRNRAIVYSCDYNSKKMDELKSVAQQKISNVNFMIADSLDSLSKIVQMHAEIDFLFLDSAASAMHTFREFMTVEKCLKFGARVLIDNAALPGERRVLSPVRKGKILVPYFSLPFVSL